MNDLPPSPRTREFPPEAFEVLFSLENGHFWFRVRNRILVYLTSRYLASFPRPHLLEIGCGTGYVLGGLANTDRYRLTGGELFFEGLRFVKKRLRQVALVQMDARDMPFQETFDAVGAFDMLEHVEDDRQIMANVWHILRQGGVFFITVPQHPWLWSQKDVQSCHKRRYSRQELINKLEEGGFTIRYVGSFLFILFPLLVLSRLKMFLAPSQPEKFNHSEEEISPRMNAILEWLLGFDLWAIRQGISLPFGGSLVAVAVKEGGSPFSGGSARVGAIHTQ